jgi:glucosamine-6-phosphate deaminase
MKLKTCKSYSDLCREVHNWTLSKIREGAKNIFIPAGNTPIGLYQIWEKEKPKDLNQVRFFQIDEIMNANVENTFKSFFLTHLPSYQKQITWIEDLGNNSDIVIPDLTILGLGRNGHIAFHEPGVDESLTIGCVKLSDITRAQLKLAQGVWGLTYGLSAFMQSKDIMLMVTGAGKDEVFKKFIQKDSSVPVTKLSSHKALSVFTDIAGH